MFAFYRGLLSLSIPLRIIQVIERINTLLLFIAAFCYNTAHYLCIVQRSPHGFFSFRPVMKIAIVFMNSVVIYDFIYVVL